ncbi:carbohydrate kinase family protein [Polynucleobacter sp. UK-Mo-2m-Kol15]|uniref:carbohydrate kinase family protein n=1 Tax=Polynucleobacter sp. UK-Mo-2m-Kol15 TaxID=2576916 RepID=UPI001C0E26CB|nr:carbohydrate kinase family protein [Polynucleobacter sp. UK-Mo-2m-Kol15]MBU3574655.1 carbohydrate kinase family protein [Polynucleobacter sp. UK-Mo-2m-Kol15]
MASLICGSIAYDTIMNFEGKFADQILPEQIHILNVAFLVPTMRREFGGCAGNIAYNLKLLGGDPIIMATVGGDATPYLDRLNQLQIDPTHIRQIEHAFTAQAMITTDQANNQITAFHPGAMGESHLNQVSAVIAERSKNTKASAKFGIVAPDGRQGMWEHCHQLAESGIPFVFDPGQGLPMFNGPELLELVDIASYVAVNDYEGEMLSQRTGLSLDKVAQRVKALIVTKGAEGADIYFEGKCIAIPPVPAAKVVDPTGCGDSFRAGLLFGLESGMDWETTGRLASLMGSIKITHQGPQNHQMSKDEIAAQFKSAFGFAI